MNTLTNEYKKPVLLDGAMGSNLDSLIRKNTFEANLTHPDLIQKIHHSYIQAGAQTLFTNSFGALERTNQEMDKKTFNKCLLNSIKIAQKAAQDKATIGLCLGPAGFKLNQAITNKTAFRNQLEHIFDLVVGEEIDFIVFETQYHFEEICFTLDLARYQCPIPIWFSVTVTEEGDPLFVKDHPDWLTHLEQLGIDILGFNCGFGPTSIVKAVKKWAPKTQLPVFAKPNKGLPDNLGNYPMTDSDFCQELLPLKEYRLFALGACCGSSAQTIKMITAETRA